MKEKAHQIRIDPTQPDSINCGLYVALTAELINVHVKKDTGRCRGMLKVEPNTTVRDFRNSLRDDIRAGAKAALEAQKKAERRKKTRREKS